MIFMWKRVLGNAIFAFGTTFAGLYYAGMADAVGVALVPALASALVALGAELKTREGSKKARKGSALIPL